MEMFGSYLRDSLCNFIQYWILNICYFTTSSISDVSFRSCLVWLAPPTLCDRNTSINFELKSMEHLFSYVLFGQTMFYCFFDTLDTCLNNVYVWLQQDFMFMLSILSVKHIYPNGPGTWWSLLIHTMSEREVPNVG